VYACVCVGCVCVIGVRVLYVCVCVYGMVVSSHLTSPPPLQASARSTLRRDWRLARAVPWSSRVPSPLRKQAPASRSRGSSLSRSSLAIVLVCGGAALGRQRKADARGIREGKGSHHTTFPTQTHTRHKQPNPSHQPRSLGGREGVGVLGSGFTTA